MAVPVSPYTNSTMVSYMLTTMLSGAPIGASTTPKKTNTDQFITWISAQVDMQFSSAGYKLPLAAISGEDWPAHQTNYLQLITTMGAAAMAGGYSLRPAPAVGSRQGGTGNAYGDLFNAELNRIFDPRTRTTTLNFRADYYAGSPAQIACTEPKGPTTDYLEGKFDPMRELDLFSVADRVLAIQQSMKDLNLSWDYMYGLYDIDKGLGSSIYELSRY